MTADHTNCMTCVVCHRRLEAGENYLVRFRGGHASAVHQHVCFPPRARRHGAGIHAQR
jgi:hypothetical protein